MALPEYRFLQNVLVLRRNRYVPVAIPMVTAPAQLTPARRTSNAPPLSLSRVTFTEPAATPLALLLLGRGSDPASERGVDCPGDLPPASDPTLVERARAAKDALGDRVFVLGHHYQRDEVIQFADVTGDSFKLAREAAARPEAEYIVFCGVHFMAESADILTSPDQQVVLPDLAAGCSMADMADYQQVVEAWDVLADAGVADCHRADHVHELLGRHQGVHRRARRRGVHLVQRRTGAALGASTAARRCCSCPTSTWAATPRCSSSASRWTNASCSTRTDRAAG